MRNNILPSRVLAAAALAAALFFQARPAAAGDSREIFPAAPDKPRMYFADTVSGRPFSKERTR